MKKSILFLAAALFGLTLAATSASNCFAGTVKGESFSSAPKEYKTVTFEVSMHCKNCAKKISENISFEKGVKDLDVSLDDKLVTITYDPAKTDTGALKSAIEKLGYEAKVKE